MKQYVVGLFLVPVCVYASDDAQNPDPRNYWNGVSTYFIKQGLESLGKGLERLESIDKASENLKSTFGSGQMREKGRELSTGLLEGASKEEVYDRSYKAGEGLVTGAATATAAALKSATTATVATAKNAAILAAPWAFVGAVVGYGYNIECQKEYGHCLRTHFDSPSVDDEKMPRRCNSPARRAFRWGSNWAEQQKNIFKILKAEGRRPRPATPGQPYWIAAGPNVMGQDDLNNGKK